MASDPFAILGLPRRFDLGRSEIESAYLARIGGVHPDGGGADGSVDDLNRARQDLLDPETRANVLLGLLGGPSKEADRALPPGFLIEMMEAREQLDAARASKDAEAIGKWGAWAEAERDEHIRLTGELFAELLREGATVERCKAIRMRLNAWRYIERMLEQLAS